jgi:hypothetical protein
MAGSSCVSSLSTVLTIPGRAGVVPGALVNESPSGFVWNLASKMSTESLSGGGVVDYSYRPRDPRGKLREVTSRWVAAMRVAGCTPNRGVVFGDEGDANAPQAYGYLVDDRRPEAQGQRYLVLQDGDVLCPPETWLGEPNDQLVTLLPKALADARLGGSGWLIQEDGGEHSLECVPDRRNRHEACPGPERRR